MNEMQRIIKLFNDLYSGSPWIDVNLASTLAKIDAADAGKKSSLSSNSIWEILNHIIEWRLNVLGRLNGEVIKSPGNNYFVPVKEQSENAWKLTVKRLEDSQSKWIKFLENFDEKDFDKIYPGNGMNYYDHIHGILQHDVYHLGQIVMLAKAAK